MNNKTYIGTLILGTLLAVSPGVFAEDYDASITLPPAYELSLPFSGIIHSVEVSAGQRVSKGDVMLSLDQSPFTTAKSRAQSRVNLQQVILKESERDLQQQQELYDRTVLSGIELENAELRVRRDQAKLETAKAALATANYKLEHSKLIAPYDALVLSVHANPGLSINNSLQSKTLITIVEQGKYQANFHVSATTLEKLTIDDTVTIDIQGNHYKGKISEISYLPSRQNTEKKHQVNAVFKIPGKTFAGIQSARVHID